MAVALGAYLTALPQTKGINFKQTDFQVVKDEETAAYVRVKAETFDGISWDRTKGNKMVPLDKFNGNKAIGEKQLRDQVNQQLGVNATFTNPLPVIAYYSVARFASATSAQIPYTQKKINWYEGYKNALDAKMNFNHLVLQMASLEDAQRRVMQAEQNFNHQSIPLLAIKRVLEIILPEISNFRTELKEQIVLMADFNDGLSCKTLSISQLSAGYQAVLAVVLDITFRLIALNHQSEDCLNGDGIVMIDEIDLHLHPQWQQQFIGKLRQAFPNIQFILTTHSPQVISTVNSGNIRILKDSKLYHAPKGTKGAEASRILKRVFQVEPRAPDDENSQLLQSYLSLVYADRWSAPEALTQREKLDKIYADEEPALTAADLYIENRQWELDIEEDQ